MAIKVVEGDVVESGIWWDLKAAKLVTLPPEEGRTVLAPGQRANAATVAMVEHFGRVGGDAAAPSKETTVAPVKAKESRKG